MSLTKSSRKREDLCSLCIHQSVATTKLTDTFLFAKDERNEFNVIMNHKVPLLLLFLIKQLIKDIM